MYEMFVGIDWASAEHAVHVEDSSGKRRAKFMVEHTEAGLDQMIRKLDVFGEPCAVPVAIERPDGLVVDRLLESGHPVIPVKPAAIKAFRSAETPSGAKSDPFDAQVIADYLRLRNEQLRMLQPFSEATLALRQTVRTRTRLVRRRVRATNHLSATLEALWPGAVAAFPTLDTQIGLAFLRRYPTPDAAGHLGIKRLEGFLARSGYGNRYRTAEVILDSLKSAPAGVSGTVASLGTEAVVLAQVEALDGLTKAIKDLDRAVESQLNNHPDGAIFSSLPRAGVINAAQILAEWGDCRQAYETADAIAALAGMSPVTRQSGKHHVVLFRWACNKWFRSAMATFADNSRHGSPWANDVYQRAMSRNKNNHAHAVRVLGRAWVRVIWRCWVDCMPYDVELHKAAKNLNS
jgi:transposase